MDTMLYTVIFFNYKILIISQHINDLCKRIKSLFQVLYHFRRYIFVENNKLIYYNLIYSWINL